MNFPHGHAFSYLFAVMSILCYNVLNFAAIAIDAAVCVCRLYMCMYHACTIINLEGGANVM